jgi:cysteine-rich repeat protein
LTNGSVICLSCNVSAGFAATPNSQGKCNCMAKYQFLVSTCVEICGDGYLMSKTYECDDGNLIDGDGCSSSCMTEVGYRCENGTTTSPSSCRFIGESVTLSLKGIEKSENLNQAIFSFSLWPALLSIGRMDLFESTNFTCGPVG